MFLVFFIFLAALQPCPRWKRGAKILTVNRKSKRQKDSQTDRKTDKDKTTFQLSYQNQCCSESQQDVRKIERQDDRHTDR